MNAKLREYLKSYGVPDDALDQIDKGQAPDRDGALRKRDDDQHPLIRKIEDETRHIRESNKVLDKIHTDMLEIKEILDRIIEGDRQRASVQKFVAAGTPIINGATDLSAIDLRGKPQ
jgi:hypothetical protein